MSPIELIFAISAAYLMLLLYWKLFCWLFRWMCKMIVRIGKSD